MSRNRIPALAYYRVSSASNIDGDSPERQRQAVTAYADARGFEIVGEYLDGAVSGEDHIEDRPQFAAMLDRIESNGVRTVLVESVDRFARKLLVQEVAIVALQTRGVKVMTSGDMNLTDNSDEYRVAMRQVAGAFAQLEKARLVKRLKSGRDRNSKKAGKRIEGRKGHADKNPALVAAVRQMLGKRKRRPSLRQIADALAAKGFTTASGKPFSAAQIARIAAQL